MDGIGRTWELMKQSFLVLGGDAKLIVFPILSGLALLPVDGWAFHVYGSQLQGPHVPIHLQPLLFLLYWVNYFVVLFFNSALMACAYGRIAGGNPTLANGLRTAWNNVGRIFIWSSVAASVGFVIQLLEQHRVVRRLIGSMLEMAWSLATFFILPVLLFEDTDVFGALYALLIFLAFAALILPAFPAPSLFSGIGLVAAVIATLSYFTLVYLVMTAVQTIFVVELYRFASGGHSDSGFAPDQLQNAFS